MSLPKTNNSQPNRVTWQAGMIQVLNFRHCMGLFLPTESQPHWKCNNTPSNWQETAFSCLTDDDFYSRAAIMKILPINPAIIYVYWETGKYDHDLQHTNDQSISRFGYKFAARGWELNSDWILYTVQEWSGELMVQNTRRLLIWKMLRFRDYLEHRWWCNMFLIKRY